MLLFGWLVVITLVFSLILGGNRSIARDAKDTVDEIKGITAELEECCADVASAKDALDECLPACLNASGAVICKGCWNANTNTPTLSSANCTEKELYVGCTPGATNIDGNALWGVGDILKCLDVPTVGLRWIRNGNGAGGGGGGSILQTWTPEYSGTDVDLENLPQHRIAFHQPLDNGDVFIEVSATLITWDDGSPPNEPRFNMTNFPFTPAGLPSAIYWTELRRTAFGGVPPNLDESILSFKTFYPPDIWELSVDSPAGLSTVHEFHFRVSYTPA